MSYDTWLTKELDGEQHTVYDVGNYTSNVRDMWKRAIGRPLSDCHEARACDLVGPLQAAIIDMKANPDTYRAMNPENGWGDDDGAREYLERLLFGCRLHPDATVYVGH